MLFQTMLQPGHTVSKGSSPLKAVTYRANKLAFLYTSSLTLMDISGSPMKECGNILQKAWETHVCPGQNNGACL